MRVTVTVPDEIGQAVKEFIHEMRQQDDPDP